MSRRGNVATRSTLPTTPLSTVGAPSTRGGRRGHTKTAEVKLSAATRQELESIAEKRETLEESIADLDELIYDLESVYLKQCVELGGGLFDGYGVERQARLRTPTSIVSATGGDLSAMVSISGPGARGGNWGGAYAFHSRVHAFSPNERLFTASSVGALARVELAKSRLADGEGGGRGGGSRRAAYGSASGRGGGRRKRTSAYEGAGRGRSKQLKTE